MNRRIRWRMGKGKSRLGFGSAKCRSHMALCLHVHRCRTGFADSVFTYIESLPTDNYRLEILPFGRRRSRPYAKFRCGDASTQIYLQPGVNSCGKKLSGHGLIEIEGNVAWKTS